MRQLIFVELNEINFEHVQHYVAKGELPTFAALIGRHGLTQTISESDYEHLEPWIQWVTAHTGKTFAEHGVFRLGDIVDGDIAQIWEVLESQDLRVGAVSPMNAKNRCREPAFFIPDPWTVTEVAGSPLLRRLHSAISQAVNDNATARLTPQSALSLVAGMIAYARPSNYARYGSILLQTLRGASGSKALLLDLILSDVFIRLAQDKKPHFATLFLNAGAHIQHHYMFNSPAYDGPHINPEWYLRRDRDPVLEVYRLYDRVVAHVIKALPQSRIMLATGLHQDPHSGVTFYWRIKDHADFLKRVGVPFARVEPRMSRDFVTFHDDATEALRAQRRLESIRAADGVPLFEVDNRGSSLFVTLSWSRDVVDGFSYTVDNAPHADLRKELAFVAIKNGHHNGVGYFLDTGREAKDAELTMPLTAMPQQVASALGVQWATRG